MALKDWKKYVWGYANKHNENYQINLVKRFKWKNGLLTNKRSGTGVIIGKGLENIEFNKTFKDYKQALKFVKAYMRTH
jgi:hypothetical protein